MDLNREEHDILEGFENDEFKSVKDLKKEITAAKKSAEAYFAKDARINIRLSGADLNLIKRLAVQEGIPYQTFISSILHKYATGRLSSQ